MSPDAKRTEVKTALKSLNDGSEPNLVKKLKIKVNTILGEHDKVVVKNTHLQEKLVTAETNIEVFKSLLENELSDHRKDKEAMEEERLRTWTKEMYKLKIKHEAQLSLPFLPSQGAEVREVPIESTGDVSDVESDLIQNLSAKQTRQSLDKLRMRRAKRSG